nr:UbiA family prenyltransferase [Pelobium sp.]
MLLPVYLFAISGIHDINVYHTLVVFIVLHLLIYPASNGYNSYFDKDEGSIALVKTPPKINRSLYLAAIALEWLGVLLSASVNLHFAIGVLMYIILSRAYSHPKTRLKKYPIISFLVVFIFQGGFIYLLTFYACSNHFDGFTNQNYWAALISSCLIGASYPLTQIYQHEEDRKRGDQTLSILLGMKGSFLFSGLVFSIGFSLMFFYWFALNQLFYFFVFVALSLPILLYFTWWYFQVFKDKQQANFKNAMRMTILSSAFMLIYFCWVVLMKFY